MLQKMYNAIKFQVIVRIVLLEPCKFSLKKVIG